MEFAYGITLGPDRVLPWSKLMVDNFHTLGGNTQLDKFVSHPINPNYALFTNVDKS